MHCLKRACTDYVAGKADPGPWGLWGALRQVLNHAAPCVSAWQAETLWSLGNGHAAGKRLSWKTGSIGG